MYAGYLKGSRYGFRPGHKVHLGSCARPESAKPLRVTLPSRLVLEIDVGERVPVGVADDEAVLAELHVQVIDGPGRREAARFHRSARDPLPPRSRLERRQLAVEPRR